MSSARNLLFDSKHTYVLTATVQLVGLPSKGCDDLCHSSVVGISGFTPSRLHCSITPCWECEIHVMFISTRTQWSQSDCGKSKRKKMEINQSQLGELILLKITKEFCRYLSDLQRIRWSFTFGKVDQNIMRIS